MTRPPFPPPSDADIATVSDQLGRPARGVVGIAARNSSGEPTVVATAPRLEDGTPFPTLYYLSHPGLTASVSKLEARGMMNELNEMLENDERLREAYVRAHEEYIRDRETLAAIPELEGVSAGGMPVRVKCLHALVAHTLAVGAGVNPIGDLALAELRENRE